LEPDEYHRAAFSAGKKEGGEGLKKNYWCRKVDMKAREEMK